MLQSPGAGTPLGRGDDSATRAGSEAPATDRHRGPGARTAARTAARSATRPRSRTDPRLASRISHTRADTRAAHTRVAEATRTGASRRAREAQTAQAGTSSSAGCRRARPRQAPETRVRDTGPHTGPRRTLGSRPARGRARAHMDTHGHTRARAQGPVAKPSARAAARAGDMGIGVLCARRCVVPTPCLLRGQPPPGCRI